MENSNQPQSSEQPAQQTSVSASTSAKSKLPLFVLIAFIFLVVIGGGGYLIQNSKLQFKSQNPSPTLVTELTPTTSIDPTANPDQSRLNRDQIGADWKTYLDAKNGYEFRYPTNYIVNDISDPEFCYNLYKSGNQQNCLAAVKFRIEYTQDDYTPQAYFYLLSKIGFVSLGGQVKEIHFNPREKIWVLSGFQTEQTLPILDYTKAGQEIIKGLNGGSHGSSYYYLIPNYQKDVVAIFDVPQSYRLRCDNINEISRQAQCNDFYKSVIQRYNKGQTIIDTWLPENYIKDLYKDAENMTKSFNFISETTSNILNQACGGPLAIEANNGCPTGYYCGDIKTIGGETSGSCIKN